MWIEVNGVVVETDSLREVVLLEQLTRLLAHVFYQQPLLAPLFASPAVAWWCCEVIIMIMIMMMMMMVMMIMIIIIFYFIFIFLYFYLIMMMMIVMMMMIIIIRACFL